MIDSSATGAPAGLLSPPGLIFAPLPTPRNPETENPANKREKTVSEALKAPFPYYGGKSRTTSEVWKRFGNVDNYIEPFFGSGAVLLGRPATHSGRYETVNDLNGFICNFWRSMQWSPEQTASYANWPVSEIDLHTRRDWLMKQYPDLVENLKNNPGAFCPRTAGYWVWGACCWIGGGWCDNARKQRPDLSELQGVHRIQLGDAYSLGRGVNKIEGEWEERQAALVEWFTRLSNRLRNVRVCCGDWLRVCGSHTTTTRLGKTGIFLDPPYAHDLSGNESRTAGLYANDSDGEKINQLVEDVRGYCLERGEDPQMRIALCGLAGEHDQLEAHGWKVYKWQAVGNRTNKENNQRERIWFSPNCRNADEYNDRDLFSALQDGAGAIE